MKTIYKYPLTIRHEQCIEMPIGAELLCAQMQGEQLCLWARMDTEEKYKSNICICICGTGNPLPDGVADGSAIYLGTVQMGQFVWHIFAL